MATTAPQLSPESPDTAIENTNSNNTNNDNNNNKIVLLNVFTIRKKSYRVFYNAGILVWERNETKKGKVKQNQYAFEMIKETKFMIKTKNGQNGEFCFVNIRFFFLHSDYLKLQDVF